MRTDTGSRLAQLQTTPYTQDYFRYNQESSAPGSSSSSGKMEDYFALDKDFQTTYEDGKNQYYDGANRLYEMAMKALEAGFDVRKPNPRNPDELEYARMFNEEKNSLLRLAEELKSGRDVEEYLAEQAKKTGKFTDTPGNEALNYGMANEMITDVAPFGEMGKVLAKDRQFKDQAMVDTKNNELLARVEYMKGEEAKLREEGKMQAADYVQSQIQMLSKALYDPTFNVAQEEKERAAKEREALAKSRNALAWNRFNQSKTEKPVEQYNTKGIIKSIFNGETNAQTLLNNYIQQEADKLGKSVEDMPSLKVMSGAELIKYKKDKDKVDVSGKVDVNETYFVRYDPTTKKSYYGNTSDEKFVNALANGPIGDIIVKGVNEAKGPNMTDQTLNVTVGKSGGGTTQSTSTSTGGKQSSTVSLKFSDSKKQAAFEETIKQFEAKKGGSVTQEEKQKIYDYLKNK